ncbi:MAG TPA: hypothetical protein VLK84_08400 [Longimicrobium sp.]|nr:hypothetical protein [Longimicrobium sp.]
MMIGGWRRVALSAAVLLAVVAPAAASAQGLTFAAGTRLYGEGEESALVASVRTEFPVGDALVLEFASSLADIPDGVDRATGSVFELQLQLPFPLGDALAPYVGAGFGVAYTQLNGASEGLEPVLSLGAGARAMFTRQLGLTLDARLRGISTEFDGEHSDVTLGLRYVP